MDSNLDLLGEQIAEDAAHIDAALHRVLTKIRIFDTGSGWYAQGFRSCAQWLSWRVGWTPGTAREHVRVANALAVLPAIDAALAHGELSYSKVRALTRVATPDNEHVLLEQARLTTGHQLEQICRKYASVRDHDRDARPRDDVDRRYVSRRDTDDGMVIIEAALHPDEAAIVWAALQRIAADRCRDTAPVDAADVPAGTPRRERPAFDRADALVHIARGVVRGDSPDRSPTELVISIPIDTLRDAGCSDPTNIACCADGTALSAHAARRLACDAGVVPMLEDANGIAVTLGRKRRTISGSMKRALLRRDRTCRFPGCHARAFLEGHHIEHWADGGATDLSNVLAVCSYHHRFVHEYGFTLELDAHSNTVTAYDDRGRAIPELASPSAIAPSDLGWPNIAHRNARLGISAGTIHCWDGTPVDYPACIDWILRSRHRPDRDRFLRERATDFDSSKPSTRMRRARSTT